MIHVRQTEIFEAESLTLSLFGEERTLIKIEKKNGEKKKSKTWGAAEQILNMQFTIATFTDGPLKKGDYSFPFGI